jgi:drug/metabolite transporter (DMT)-like permease
MSASPIPRSNPDATTLAAFLAIVGFGGVNAVAVRLSNAELAPFWGAASRFLLAAAILSAIMLARRVPIPRGTALRGTLLYGVLGFGLSYALLYWGLVAAPAGLAAVMLAVVPLLTLLFAFVHGLERISPRGALGAVVAVVGVAVIFGDRLSLNVPLLPMLAIVGGTAVVAETNVVVKLFPKCHPVANNAIAMAVGAGILLGASLLIGEPKALPAESRTWAALAYLVLVGSVGLFMLFLYVISRWTASATSYAFILMPLVTITVAALIAGETVTPAFLVGGAVVLTGAVIAMSAPPPTPVPAPTAATESPAAVTTPTCA